MQQQVVQKRKMGMIYNYSDYKKRLPFFQKPIKITLANNPYESYLLVKNIVYKGKQILALKNEHNPDTIILVEAIIENGKLLCISKLPDEYIIPLGELVEEFLEKYVY